MPTPNTIRPAASNASDGASITVARPAASAPAASASVPHRPCQNPVRHIVSSVKKRATIHSAATPPPAVPPLTAASRCGNSGDIAAHRT